MLSLARSTRAAVISIERLDGAEARLPNSRYMPFEDPAQYTGIQEHAARYFLDMSATAAALAAESPDLWLDAVFRDAAVAATAETRLARDRRSHDPMRLNDIENAERLGFFASADDVLVRDADELAPEFRAAADAYAASAAEFAGSLGG